MKTCICCHKELDISEFYKHPQMSDGHLNKCKECCKKQSRNRSVLKRDYIAAYDIERNKTESRKSQKRQQFIRYVQKYKQKRIANVSLGNAVRDGKIIKPNSCQLCGRVANEGRQHSLHGHHEDYNKPLDVIWVCAQCHKRIHSNHNAYATKISS